MMGLLLLMNGCFALLYMALGPTGLHGTEQMGLDVPFLRAFTFSIGVFSTTGTGSMFPVGPTAS